MANPSESSKTLQNILLIGLAIVFPPIPVFLLDNYRALTKPMLITVLLTVFGHIPGVIFAIYYIIEHEKFHSHHHHHHHERSQYSRLDDEQQIPETVPAVHNHVDHPPLAPVGRYTDDEIDHSHHGEPPKYQDITEGGSKGQSDSKAVLGDHKVQQD